MRSIIEELYYGNITLTDRDIVADGSYEQSLKLVARHEEALNNSLTEAQKETFEKFKDCVSELGDADELMAFTQGFKIGMRLTIEALSGVKDILEPHMN